MASTIKLDIVTPEDIVYSQNINVLVAPAMDGEIGILPKHTPLVTGLNTGVLEIKKDEEDIKVAISDGFMEVQPDEINIVVRTAELPQDIDVERARKARKRAQKRLDSADDKIDNIRARAALERAVARLKAVE
ncbi:MAG: F0F1 ATP synthase subunit epsilon [Halothermotrichaceae bacterium]